MATSSHGSLQTVFRVSRSSSIEPLSRGSDPDSFLSVPETPQVGHDIPFKAPFSDQSSVRMKSRHHARQSDLRRYSNISNLRAGGYDAATASPRCWIVGACRSKSMPSLRVSTTSSQWHAIVSRSRCHDVNNGKDVPRRWTLPSKAPCTTAVTHWRTLVKQSRMTSRISPAIITLRRSTNQFGEKSNLTFFPPPSFGRNRDNFMSYFQTAAADQSHPPVGNREPLDHNIKERGHGRSVSISVDNAQPTASAIAKPMMTEAPTNAYFTDNDNIQQLRRCSTKYISGSSVYEVLWDQDEISSATSSVSLQGTTSQPESSLLEFANDRRQSVAMDKLETQLTRSTGGPVRRISSGAQQLLIADDGSDEEQC